MAFFTVEVHMHVVVLLAVVPAAWLVLDYSATVLDAMDEVMLLEHGECPEYA